MNVNVKGTNYEITPEVRAYLDERLIAIERLITADESAVICDVELGKRLEQEHGPIWRAEMNLQIEGELLRAEADGESINAAIDEVKDEIMKRLRRSKGKRFDLFKKGALKAKEWMRFGREG